MHDRRNFRCFRQFRCFQEQEEQIPGFDAQNAHSSLSPFALGKGKSPVSPKPRLRPAEKHTSKIMFDPAVPQGDK